MTQRPQPYKVVTVEDGAEVVRVYPTFGRAWDATVDAHAAGHVVRGRWRISEDEYQRLRDGG